MAGVQIDGVNNKIDFDDDQDTSISANTDDTLVFEVGAATVASWTSTVATFNDSVVITTADNSDTLTLTSTDADASVGPALRLYRNSASPADDDELAKIRFDGKNSAGEDVTYGYIQVQPADVTDGTEDGFMQLQTMVGGTSRGRVSMYSYATVMNEHSQDIDFRVESNGDANCFVVDAGGDRVDIRTGGANLGGVLNVLGGTVLAIDDNSDVLTLQTTDADSNVGPVLNFSRDSSSPANNDFLGELTFQGKNNAGDDHDYIRVFARILNVADGSEQADFIMKDATGNNIVNFAHSEVAYNDDSVDRDFRVEGNGNANMLFVDAGNDRLGIGTNSPSVPMHLKQSSNDLMSLIHNEATSGNVFGQQINFSSTVDDNTSYFFRCVGNNQSTVRAVIFSDGDIQNADNSYGSTSDERIKEQIKDANSQWDDIKALKIKNYKLKEDVADKGDSDDLWRLGVVAQDLETAGMNGLVKPEVKLEADHPEVVNGEGNVGDIRDYKGVKYSILYMKAVKALQEAQTRIETLETKVAALEG